MDAWKDNSSKFNYGDGLDQEVKGAARTESKRKKKGKGGRGEKLDPIVQNRNDLTAKLAEGVDFAEEWWVETVQEGTYISTVLEAVCRPSRVVHPRDIYKTWFVFTRGVRVRSRRECAVHGVPRAGLGGFRGRLGAQGR